LPWSSASCPAGLPYLTSRSILELRELLEHLIVVGGGFVGSEFAQMFARFGSRVTVVQRDERLLVGEEPELSELVRGAFEAEGIEVLTGAECVGTTGGEGEVRIACEGAEDTKLSGTHLLLAAGRVPNTDTLGLEELELEPDGAGYLRVDDHLRTDAEDVWALGDLRGGRCSPIRPATMPTASIARSIGAGSARSPSGSFPTRYSSIRSSPRLG
jgi:pyruvate/2-oxoglutarate dehydrogenase complex dihydrolipoamide dehydrogenase (E3) component